MYITCLDLEGVLVPEMCIRDRYTASTKSIPALAVPEEVVVFCTE